MGYCIHKHRPFIPIASEAVGGEYWPKQDAVLCV